MSKNFQVKRITKDDSGACKLLKKRLCHRCFPVDFANFKNTFLYRTPPVVVSDNTIFTTESIK